MLKRFGRWTKVERFSSTQLLIVMTALLFLSGALVVTSSMPARAGYASIVIEAETGKVLSETDADAPNHPASLTKMMTLYLTFEALQKGRLHLDQALPVSEHAASRAPSKLDLQPGESVTVRDLILGIVTKSANDAATVLAEALGGTERGFAERMNQKARQLGMSRTFYHNASGLPDPEQITTARDLARLALALYRDFPKEYHYFSTEEFTFRGATFTNHNHLMKAFEGMDGIKTGYIRASGFNLAASAVRGNRRLIGIVMGGESAHARDLKMAALLNQGFGGRPGETMTASADDEDAAPAPAPQSLARRAARTIAALSPVGHAEAAPAAAPRAGRGRGQAEHWSIQLGAFTQHAMAEKAGSAALAKLHGVRGKTVQVIGPLRTDKERLYRARIISFSEADAEKACHTLRKKHKACAVVAPTSSLRVASR